MKSIVKEGWFVKTHPSCLHQRFTKSYGQALPLICPELLEKVQVFEPQLVCCAVNWKVLVPMVETTVTPVVALKPAGVPEVIVPAL